MAIYKPISAKVIVGHEALGTPDLDLVEKRAREVAEIEEHAFPNEADWAEARRELHGLAGSTEGGTDGETLELLNQEDAGDAFAAMGQSGAGAIGSSVVTVEESTLGEELIREGMEEAEHERMLLARHRAPK